jgi:molybdopterin adenylyltransferase
MAANSTRRAKILILSDRRSSGTLPDLAGPAIRTILEAHGWEVCGYEIIPDDLETISSLLARWVDHGDCGLIVTSGGTGLAPRDVTPEATRAVIQREIPGLAELMRSEGLKHTRRAALGRGIAGVRKQTLILNLPGSVNGARDSLAAVIDLLPHALDTCHGLVDHEP